jgi:hypothetical protein
VVINGFELLSREKVAPPIDGATQFLSTRYPQAAAAKPHSYALGQQLSNSFQRTIHAFLPWLRHYLALHLDMHREIFEKSLQHLSVLPLVVSTLVWVVKLLAPLTLQFNLGFHTSLQCLLM